MRPLPPIQRLALERGGGRDGRFCSPSTALQPIFNRQTLPDTRCSDRRPTAPLDPLPPSSASLPQVSIMRKNGGPDASCLNFTTDPRFRLPEVELFFHLLKCTVTYAFWLLIPFYIFQQRYNYSPQELVYTVSPAAVLLVLFVVYTHVLKLMSSETFLSMLALKVVAFFTLIVLGLAVLNSITSMVQVVPKPGARTNWFRRLLHCCCCCCCCCCSFCCCWLCCCYG